MGSDFSSNIVFSAHIVDAILFGVGVEFLFLRAGLLRAGRRALVLPLGLFLLSGAALLLALRAALAGAGFAAVGVCLFAGFCFHALLLLKMLHRNRASERSSRATARAE